jgi:hypothetical protein
VNVVVPASSLDAMSGCPPWTTPVASVHRAVRSITTSGAAERARRRRRRIERTAV